MDQGRHIDLFASDDVTKNQLEWISEYVTGIFKMTFIDNWDDFYKATEQLYLADPLKVCKLKH